MRSAPPPRQRERAGERNLPLSIRLVPLPQRSRKKINQTRSKQSAAGLRDQVKPSSFGEWN